MPLSTDVQQIFGMYYSGYKLSEIALLRDTTENHITKIIQTHGKQWVNSYLKQEHRNKLKSLVKEGLSSTQIAERIHWSRWVVIFTLRRMAIDMTNLEGGESIVEPQWLYDELKLRCPICNSTFISSLKNLANNPDRICSSCIDRRQSDRRNKESRRADDDIK